MHTFHLLPWKPGLVNKVSCVPNHRSCSTPTRKDKYLSPSQRGESSQPK